MYWKFIVCTAHRLQCKTPHFPKRKFPVHATRNVQTHLKLTVLCNGMRVHNYFDQAVKQLSLLSGFVMVGFFPLSVFHTSFFTLTTPLTIHYANTIATPHMHRMFLWKLFQGFCPPRSNQYTNILFHEEDLNSPNEPEPQEQEEDKAVKLENLCE